MSKLLNSGQVGNLSFKNMIEQRKEIVRKWNESGILDGFKEGRINIADLMESEAAMILDNPFNLTYYMQRFGQHQAYGNTEGMHFCLIHIIRLTSKKIMEDHCE